MPMLRRFALLSILLTSGACLGPVARPVTGPVPTGASVRITQSGDTLRLRWTDATLAGSDATEPCATKQLEGVIQRVAGDTVLLRSVSFAIPARGPTDPACQRRGGAMIIAPAASLTLETLEPVSTPVQIGGSLLMIGVVLGVSLLLFNAADGLFGIVGRWF